MQTVELLSQLEALKPQLRAEGVAHLSIFGSRARGRFRADSDLDLLVEVDAGGRFSILNLVGVEHIVSDTLGIAANAFMRRSLDDDFERSISADLVEVF